MLVNENVIKTQGGSINEAKHAKQPTECWELFFSDDISLIVLFLALIRRLKKKLSNLEAKNNFINYLLYFIFFVISINYACKILFCPLDNTIRCTYVKF